MAIFFVAICHGPQFIFFNIIFRWLSLYERYRKIGHFPGSYLIIISNCHHPCSKEAQQYCFFFSLKFTNSIWWFSFSLLILKHLQCLTPYLIIIINVTLWLNLLFYPSMFKLRYNKHIILGLVSEKYKPMEAYERYYNSLLEKHLVLKILNLLLI